MLKNYEWKSESLRKSAVAELSRNQDHNKKCAVAEFSENQNRNKKCAVVESLKDQKSLLYMKSFRSKIFMKFAVDKHLKCCR